VRFTLAPQEPVDFLFLNEHTSTNPESVFLKQHYLQRHFPWGSAHIMNRTLTLRRNRAAEIGRVTAAAGQAVQGAGEEAGKSIVTGGAAGTAGQAPVVLEESREIISVKELRELVVRYFLPDLPEDVPLRL
jgi:hypothetical protein